MALYKKYINQGKVDEINFTENNFNLNNGIKEEDDCQC